MTLQRSFCLCVVTVLLASLSREVWSLNERGFERRFSFDKQGNPLKIVEENGAEHPYTYDPDPPRAFDRLSETDSIGRLTSYTYNAQNLIETSTLPTGAVLEYRDYTAAFAQPQRIKDARGNWTWLRYDTAGNLTDRIALKSGVAGVADTLPAASDMRAWVKTAYDSAGNPTTSTRVANFTIGSGPSLTRNWDSGKFNLLSLTRNGAQVNETSPTFTYDPQGRLTAVIDPRWYPQTLSQRESKGPGSN